MENPAARRRSAPDVAIVELQLRPHPLVHGRNVNFEVFSTRSDCGYHHSCDDKHELNRGQHQQIAHCGSSMQWPHSINALHRPVFLQAGGQERVRRAHAQLWGLRGVGRPEGPGRQ
ncbi:MAG TPA: hypothetical protein VGX03_22915 [Candidatus Binatia bacterium]|nr:hypothetical protein [Candidatus Binatia bacterium]